ncbi:MAG: autophagy protein atg9 [Bathelium mastoideum]|nr:MAG: autophagy protein atg9 [Bathelium mastoideum]
MLSSLLRNPNGGRSIYETMKEDEERSDTSDRLNMATMALDEANLQELFHGQDLGHMLQDATESQVTTESTAFLGGNGGRNRSGRTNTSTRSRVTPKWMRQQRNIDAVLDEEEDVPESLLLEGGRRQQVSAPNSPDSAPSALPPPVPGPSNQSNRTHWSSAQEHQPLHEDLSTDTRPIRNRQARTTMLIADPKEKAMWRWTNVYNLDNFLGDVYTYYTNHGFWSIMLARFLNMLMSTILNIAIYFGALVWIFAFIQNLLDIRRLWHLHEFYHHLLGIPDGEIQTVSWQYIVQRLMALRDNNPITAPNLAPHTRKLLGNHSKQRMDAHDIANRLMRRENYLIALFNKAIFDFSLPIPFLRKRQFFSNLMMLNIDMAIMDFFFDEKGHIKPGILRETSRRDLVRGINNRLLLAAWLNFVASPVVIFYALVMYFYRNFLEFKERPSQAGAREWTALAKWKFREFNELPHLCNRRLRMAYPFADAYLEQFPKDKVTQATAFVAFVSGALAGVLGLATLIDPELFLGFEITHDRTALFYLTVLTAIFAAARNSLPEETFVSDPELHLREVIERIHYKPAHWEDRLHSVDVRNEFSSLYQVKPVLFVEEMLGNLLTPFILLITLPKCSERVVDFFREFTIHVDGIGHVCSFAVFDFKKGANAATETKGIEGATDFRDDYYSTKDGKMLASYYGFMADYGASRAGRPGPHQRSSNKKSFRPPPAFPGLASPESGIPTSRGPSNKSQLLRRDTPRHGTGVGHSSPVQSLVLDPHHQPAGSTLPQSPQHTGSRVAPMRHASRESHSDDVKQATAEASTVAAAAIGSPTPQSITTSKMIEDDSHLGDSWTTERPGGFRGGMDDDEDGDEADDAGHGGAGVLGLLYQFQKAHTSGRTTGMNV